METNRHIETILKHWDFGNAEVVERFREDSPRVIRKIKAENQFFILKGIPEEKPESVIRGNVAAHRFLGNEKGMAPRVFAAGNGDFYVRENGFDYAQAFLRGYYGDEEIARKEYDALWAGAVYMQISYMKCYGSDAVDSLWKILEFGLAQKEALWDGYGRM